MKVKGVEDKVIALADARIGENADLSSVGARVRALRKSRKWSLAKLSERSGIPQSTLSKFETGGLSLPLDRVFRLSDALGQNLTELFDDLGSDTAGMAGRLSVHQAGEGRLIDSDVYQCEWLFSDLIQKKMFPVIQEVVATSLEEFGPLLRHEGEEFSYVIDGEVLFCSEVYEPKLLKQGSGVYLDSRAGHAYLKAGEGKAVIMNVSTSALQLPPNPE